MTDETAYYVIASEEKDYVIVTEYSERKELYP